MEITAAPESETLLQVRDRLVLIGLEKIKPKHATVTAFAALYRRKVDGDATVKEELDKSRVDLARALDIDIDLDHALTLAIDLAHAVDSELARDLDLDLGLAFVRAHDLDFAHALALARARAHDLCSLLGDRLLAGRVDIDRQILDKILASGANIFDMDSYHCGTTHCRAGWAITMHPLGHDLEKVFGSWLAGAVIYLDSRRGTALDGEVPDFFASNEAALDDIRLCASA